MANDNGSGNALALLSAMFVGVVVGAVAALLLAPKSGPELRGELGEAAQRAEVRAAAATSTWPRRHEELRAGSRDIKSGAHGPRAAEELAADVRLARGRLSPTDAGYAPRPDPGRARRLRRPPLGLRPAQAGLKRPYSAPLMARM